MGPEEVEEELVEPEDLVTVDVDKVVDALLVPRPDEVKLLAVELAVGLGMLADELLVVTIFSLLDVVGLEMPVELLGELLVESLVVLLARLLVLLELIPVSEDVEVLVGVAEEVTAIILAPQTPFVTAIPTALLR